MNARDLQTVDTFHFVPDSDGRYSLLDEAELEADIKKHSREKWNVFRVDDATKTIWSVA